MLPNNVLRRLESSAGETVKPNDPRLSHVETHLIATPQMALTAAADVARQAGVEALILGDSLEGEARVMGKVMAGIALQAKHRNQTAVPPSALLSGAEDTVTVRGTARGGRKIA